MSIELSVTVSPEIAAILDQVRLDRASVLAAMAEEVAERRLHWFAGIPTELDLHAARKAVSRRLKIDLQTVEAFLATPVPPVGEV